MKVQYLKQIKLLWEEIRESENLFVILINKRIASSSQNTTNNLPCKRTGFQEREKSNYTPK